MGDIRPIFWSQIDDCIVKFPLYNKPLQRISYTYPVYFVHSGTKCFDMLKDVYPNVNFISCSHNDKNEKANVLFNLLKLKDDYDILIRSCCDSVITDTSKLLDILVDKLLGKHAIIGNVMYKHGKIKLVRGGCNAVSRSVINQIGMLQTNIAIAGRGFDRSFTAAVQRTDAEVIPYNLFGEGRRYFSKFPVCHPKKTGNRFRDFLRIIRLVEKVK